MTVGGWLWDADVSERFVSVAVTELVLSAEELALTMICGGGWQAETESSAAPLRIANNDLDINSAMAVRRS